MEKTAVYTDKSFLRYLGKLMVIRPFRKESVTGVGYDLTVGLFAHVDPFKREIVRIVIVDETDNVTITLEPNTYGIVISKEYVFLSKRLAGTFHSKSSLAAQAVYLNSTTCDPNWKGRLIFSLYNASGNSVSLDLDKTFTTMCIHEVERPSELRPKESKVVIEKYLEGLEGDVTDILLYVLKDDKLKHKFDDEVENARRWASVPHLVLRIYLRIVDIIRFIGEYWLAISGLVATATVITLLLTPGIVLDQFFEWFLKTIGFLAASTTLWDVYRKKIQS